ncbi:YybH family protein [Nocardia macrotermitis]|uniref:SnoaL-like domain-containing protein n=1 Tax=Nocardia macrotermitis TaxID=2585198 RepID=A0A7K0D8K8_9NOCA|nr:nuclear transport factor 2 family protein [Nocardia macrotermitis]MQY22048.1 hypothetical protein [Nocardia macrotermitis]
MMTQNDFRSHADDAESEETRIRRRLDQIGEALRAKDLDALARAYTTDVVSFDVEAPLQHVGVAAKLANWVRVFEVFEHVTYELRDLRFTVSGEVAFGHGFARLHGTLKDGTETNGMWVRATYGMRRIEGTWAIAHDQVSVPLDVLTGRGVVDLEP